jgi:osmotically-inducible protein OsmY
MKENITLTGAVESKKQKEHATSIVKSVYGVHTANNLLMIKK